jgi:type II secretory pathway pseudopilin PulG
MRKRKAIGVAVLVATGILAILAGLVLPPLARAKAKANRAVSINNLKQVGLGIRHTHNDLAAPFIITGAVATAKIRTQEQER